MKILFFLLPVLFFIKASAQEPYYDFKKFRENNLPKGSFKKPPGKIQPLSRIMGKITWSDANGTFILPLDKNMSIDSLQKTMELIQKLRKRHHMGTLVYIQPNGTRIYELPQDNMPCLVLDISQFNMPVLGKETKITGMPPGSLPPNEIIPK
ncbi:MAG TPA: hypothetical protein VIU35_11085 [Chitinophagaceae bacterium]